VFKKSLNGLLLPALAILIGFLIFLYTRPLPSIEPVIKIVSVPKTEAISLPWPTSGQAALGVSGGGVLASHNAESPVPIASIAKIITALAVLEKKPLATGAQGPNLTFSQADVDSFNYYYANDGSVAQVNNGETLTEYQALQAMLLPSANNIADSMARWAFGSVDAYVVYANEMVKNMGLSRTVVGGASGFDDKTTSTADDLVKLGIAAMAQPAIAQVVSQSSADIPVAGTVHNVNWLLGTDGVVGIKTGNTDKAGGCYLFAAIHTIAGRQVTLVGAVLGLDRLNDAISASRPLIESADNGFEVLTLIHKGQVMATYQTGWGETTQAIASNDVSVLAWKGQAVKPLNEPQILKAPIQAGTTVGRAAVGAVQEAKSTPLTLTKSIRAPSWRWRIVRH
jgi:D-alanyl-D-alanine carboxypeptidase (penicillin-binding protein 5/6)